MQIKEKIKAVYEEHEKEIKYGLAILGIIGVVLHVISFIKIITLIQIAQ